jgi:hypothetical protein
MCVHIYIYICIYTATLPWFHSALYKEACQGVCLYACIHVCMYACLTYVCLTYMYACMHVCMYVCLTFRRMCVCIDNIYIYIYIYIYIHTYIYTYIHTTPAARSHTHTLTYIHTYEQEPLSYSEFKSHTYIHTYISKNMYPPIQDIVKGIQTPDGTQGYFMMRNTGMHVYVGVCTHVCFVLFLYVCMYVFMRTNPGYFMMLNTGMYVFVCVCIYIYIYICLYVCVYL